MSLKWSADDILAFIRQEFPQALRDGTQYEIVTLEPGRAVVRMRAGDAQLRPGGTVSGPAMMALVDFSVYALLLAHHRQDARLAVTTNLNMSFLRKPRPGAILADVELLKHGRTLSVARVALADQDGERAVASAEVTYFMGGS